MAGECGTGVPSGGMTPFWVTAFRDLPAGSFDRGVAFWSGVTGYALSSSRGDHQEFATLEPPAGDAFLRVQRVFDGPGGLHLDLHVTDRRAAADAAVNLGAVEVADLGHVVMRSPGGFTFCFVDHPAAVRPPAAEWEGTRSLVDQVCLDIPHGGYDEECAFWAAVTGWDLAPSRDSEFRSLVRPPDIPLRFLLQRLGEAAGPVRGHLDLAAEDRAAEVRRHAGLGAELVAEHHQWTVLRDPVGFAYCVTDRNPTTGLVSSP
jgi:hypothetical protein